MPLNKPDILQHNNPNNAIADASFVRGGARSVANLTELYQIASGVNTKVDQLKQNVTRVYVSGEDRYYLLKDIANASGANGWKLENYVYATGTQTISGAKTFTNLITANQLDMFDVDLFQISGVNLLISNGDVEFKIRPTVNGSGIQLRGEVADAPPSLIFDGNRNIKRSTFPSGVNAGGADIINFVNNVFFPTVPISVSLKNTPLLSAETSYPITFSGSIVGNDDSDAILGQLIYTNATNNQVVNINSSPTFGNFYYTGSNISSNTNIKVDLVYFKGTQKQISQNATMAFEYPIYYATGVDNLTFDQILYINGTSISGLRPGVSIKLEQQSDKKFTFTTNNEIIYAIFPSTWGPLYSIQDQNQLENIAGWQLYLQPSNYYVYKSRYYSSVSNFNLTFKY
jgi:hypothetical protein